MEKQEYSFEVKFNGPLIENIVAYKTKLTEVEQEEVGNNFFDKIYNNNLSVTAFIAENDYYADYTLEAISEEEALETLKTELVLLEKEGILAENVKKTDLSGIVL